MTEIHNPAGLSFLSPVKIGAPPSEKVSWSLKIQMRMLSHSEGLGILILTKKDAFWRLVDVCEGNRSFRTEVISYSSY